VHKCLELDELYWFLERKEATETHENLYVMTMVSRTPRQITAFAVARDKSSWRIQEMVDSVALAERYCSDGYHGYLDVDYYGAEHVRNIHDKSETYTVEGVNADLRHYIPVLARRSRCFPRKLDTLQAVIEVFVDAYNAFGIAKYKFRQGRDPKSRELPFSVLDFL
jgi:IS1 family transposase